MITIQLDKLRQTRQSKEISITDIANNLGINKSTISRYENGKTRIPADVFLYMIHRYDLSIDDVVEYYDES
jgi:transcriptional regulator with XRE-family HTH domain